MRVRARLSAALLLALLASSNLLAQNKTIKSERRPPAEAAADNNAKPPAPTGFFSILDGQPMLLTLHHDTEVNTNKPIDIYEFVIEMQVLNSDGGFEPEGLQIHNFYTAKAQQPQRALNARNAHDCKVWNAVITTAMANRSADAKVWPYIEFVTDQGARTVTTNEHGQVFWSDDIECWGSMDRFPPF